jgi:hypothetical protein
MRLLRTECKSVIVAAMLDGKQRHRILVADRTRDVTWLRAVIEHLMTADPDVTLAEIEDVLRAAAGNTYLVGTPDGFEIVVGFAAWRDALNKAGVTVKRTGRCWRPSRLRRPPRFPELRARTATDAWRDGWRGPVRSA